MNLKDFKQLIAYLPESLDEFEVIMSRDPEGNSFHEFYELDFKMIDSKSAKYYDPHSNELCFYNEDDYDSSEEFFDHVSSYEQLKPCIILWP